MLAADHDDFVGFGDAAAHALGPRLGHLAAFGAARDGEGREVVSLLGEPLVQILVVLEVEAQVDADDGRSAGVPDTSERVVTRFSSTCWALRRSRRRFCADIRLDRAMA